MFETIAEILWECWLVLGQMAPYLLLGFLVAGILSVCISAAWIERHLGGRGLYPVGAASLFGVPLPLCSCGVIPVTASIRRHGASSAATASFLISTPQTGVDSIAVTYALLGPVFAVFRPVAALATGLLGGGLVQWFDHSSKEEDGEAKQLAAETGEDTSECADAETACCGDDCTTPTAGRGGRFGQVLRYGFVTLPRDIGPSLLMGVVIAGLIGALVPQRVLEPWLGGGVGSILLMMAASIPVYVCATASVPIAAGLIVAGISPGAALAFLIAGPATNAATVTTLWRIVGRRVTLIYLGTIAVSSVAGGLILNALLSADWVPPVAAAHDGHGHEAAGALGHLWAAALLAVLLVSYLWKTGHRHGSETPAADSGGTDLSDSSTTVTLKIDGMSCSHCAAAVHRALLECRGVLRADVDLDAGKAEVDVQTDFDPASCTAAISELGYKAEMT